jgi:hypothetical protein
MSVEENKAVVGRWFTEFWGKRFNPARRAVAGTHHANKTRRNGRQPSFGLPASNEAPVRSPCAQQLPARLGTA